MRAGKTIPSVGNTQSSQQIVVTDECVTPLCIRNAAIQPHRQFLPSLRVLRKPDWIVLIVVRRITERGNRAVSAAERWTVGAGDGEDFGMCERESQRALPARRQPADRAACAVWNGTIT